jgi:A/G-specific adenine glycosylase
MNEAITADSDTAAFARQELLNWFKTSARAFPWRNDHDPYHVLIAEMMLRRTQARQVVAVYQRFLHLYPDVHRLDQAPAEEVASVLYPLGLAWRAVNFKLLAHEIVTRHNGMVPREREALLALTGVGSYVAEAVRCFAFNEPAVIVDTNTVRVAARYFGFAYNAESRRRKPVIHAVACLVDEQQPASSNYALLDFAAVICSAQKPEHTRCPLAACCAYYRKVRQQTTSFTTASGNTILEEGEERLAYEGDDIC